LENVVPFRSGIGIVKHPACNNYYIRALCLFWSFWWPSFEAHKKRLADRGSRLAASQNSLPPLLYIACFRHIITIIIIIIIIIIKVLKKRILHIKCLDAFHNLKKELSQNRYVFIALL